ncbi:MAG: tyrosine-protein phosphatase [bacterium]|nr:tyrosine-protein phosphatase [bacterium]
MENANILWLIIGIVALAIGFIAFNLWRIRRPLPYPPPESLIIPAHTQFIPIDGVINFRDIGGVLTSDGKQVQTGKIYRSASLSYITPTGKQDLMALRPRLICDLRSHDEVTNDPDPTFDAIRAVNIGMATEGDKAKRLWMLLFRPKKLNTMLHTLYIDVILEENAPALSTALHTLLEADNLPVIIHCTAGKDRTGVIVALILALVGVSEAEIVADYSQSNHYYAHYEQIAHQLLRRLAFLRLNSHNLFPILIAHPDTMRAVFDYLRAKYGGVAGYAESRLGFDGDKVNRLKMMLLG